MDERVVDADHGELGKGTMVMVGKAPKLVALFGGVRKIQEYLNAGAPELVNADWLGLVGDAVHGRIEGECWVLAAACPAHVCGVAIVKFVCSAGSSNCVAITFWILTRMGY